MVRQLSIEPEGKPRAIIANTIKGKGVSFMERCIEYHYRVPETEERLRQALREIEEGF
jgi:transketolase